MNLPTTIGLASNSAAAAAGASSQHTPISPTVSITNTATNATPPITTMSTPTPLSEAVDMPEGRDVQRQTAGNYQQLRLLRACDYCRKRKVKCNGERPACSHCRRVGAHCHYSVKPKSRRTWKCLERAASSDNTSTAPADIKPNSGSSSGTVTAAATAAAVAATTTTTYNDETARLFERVEAMEKLLLHHQKQQEMQKANRARGNTPSSKLSVTGLGLCTPWMMPGTNSTIVDLPPKEIVQELVDIFFGRELGYSWIIHEQTFRKQLVQGQVPDILLYAVMAKASKYSRHPAIRVNPPSDAPLPFLHRAKLLVPHIIDKPCLAHAQALMLMASDFSGLGEDHATTAYKSLTLNMCIDLGYNRLDGAEQASYPNANPPLTDWVERESARRLWWAIFRVENYAAVSIFVAPSIQAEYCDVNLPCDQLEWKRDRSDPDSARKRQKPNPVHNYVSYHSQLSLLFSKVAWLVTHTRSPSVEALNEFHELNMVLRHWYDSLPSEVRLDSSADVDDESRLSPFEYYYIVLLHLYYYAAIIQLNRGVLEFTDDKALIEASQEKCTSAAVNMTNILRATRDIPPDNRDVNWYLAVFKAAIVHCYRLLCKDPAEVARAQHDLALHRQQLRQGARLWRTCYKLLNNIDDMEQMVRMLPTYLPVSDIVWVRKIFKYGRNFLINQQFSDLINGIVCRGDGGDTSTSSAAAAAAPPPSHQSQKGEDTGASLMLRITAASTNRDVMNTVAVPQHQGPASERYSTSSPEYNSGGGGGGGGRDGSGGSGRQLTQIYSPQGLPVTAASLHNQQPLQAPITAPFAPIPQYPTVPPPPLSTSLTDTSDTQQQAFTPDINSNNLVIDNDMAETLINYLYMLSNSGNGVSPSGATMTSATTTTGSRDNNPGGSSINTGMASPFSYTKSPAIPTSDLRSTTFASNLSSIASPSTIFSPSNPMITAASSSVVYSKQASASQDTS